MVAKQMQQEKPKCDLIVEHVYLPHTVPKLKIINGVSLVWFGNEHVDTFT